MIFLDASLDFLFVRVVVFIQLDRVQFVQHRVYAQFRRVFVQRKSERVPLRLEENLFVGIVHQHLLHLHFLRPFDLLFLLLLFVRLLFLL